MKKLPVKIAGSFCFFAEIIYKFPRQAVNLQPLPNNRGEPFFMKRLLLFLLLISACFSIAQAQINLSGCGVNYNQNFNTLPRNPSVTNRCNTYFTWTDNVTIPGWYISQQANRHLVDNGSCNTGSIYSFGTDGATDRALGSFASASNASISYGAQFRNNTSGAVNRLTIRYTGETWRGCANANTLAFEYSLDATSLTTGTWLPATNLNFTQNGGNNGVVLNGNLTQNRQVINGTVDIPAPQVVNAGQTFWIRFTDVDNTGGDAGFGIDDFRISMNVQPLDIAGTNQICRGDNGLYFYGVNNAGNGITYTWTGFPPNTSLPFGTVGNFVLVNWQAVTPGTYNIRATATGFACAATQTFQVQVFSMPTQGTISAPQTVCLGSNAGTVRLTNFAGQVVGWETSTDNFVSNFTFFPQSPPNANFNYLNLVQTTSYRAYVQNGPCLVLSNPVTITVIPNTQPGFINPFVTTVCGDINSTTLTLFGQTGSVLRWESSTNNFTTVSTILNTQTTLQVDDLPVTTQYRAVVRNGNCATLFSDITTITVNPIPNGGTLLEDQSICLGETAGTLTLTDYAGDILQWESSTDNFATVTMINVTTPTYDPGVVFFATQYRVLVNSPGCGSAYSNPITITVSPQPFAGTLSAAQTLCAGSTGNMLTLTGTFGDILRWESSFDNFQTITTINNQTTTHDFGVLTRTTKFRVAVNFPGCAVRYTNQVEIQVTQGAKPGTLTSSASGTSCSANSGTITMSGHSGTIVRWESSLDGVNWTTINHTLASYNYNVSVPTQYRVVLTTAGCTEVTSVSITVASGFSLTVWGGMQCTGTGMITASASGGTPAYRYFIIPNSGTQTSPGVFTGVASGTYTINVIDANNCTAKQTVTIPLAVSAPTITGVTTLGGGSVKVMWNVVAPGGNNVSYQIRFKLQTDATWGTPIAVNTNTYTAGLTPNMAYQVQVRVRCAGQQTWSAWSATWNFNSGMRLTEEISVENTNTISVFPNPSKGLFNLQMSDAIISQLTITDLTGRIVLEKSINATENEILIPNATAGIYLLRLQTGEKLKTMKLIVE